MECLKTLPPKVQRGLLNKADELRDCSNPAATHKPLTGPLAGYYRMTYSRFRAIYRVDREELASGDVFVTIVVTFVHAGIRKERSKEDVYKIALDLVKHGIVPIDSAQFTLRRPGQSGKD